MSEHGPQWDRDEEFRQSVIRKALLLGFSCCSDQIGTSPAHTGTWYHFYLEGRPYYGYMSIYSAAYDYLRLMQVPLKVIGDYRG